MSFNEQVNNLGGPQSSSGSSIFNDGVPFKMLRSSDTPILFRIMPAFDHSRLDASGKPDPMSWVPFRDQSGSFSPWGCVIWMSSFIGHGQAKQGMRKDIVSMWTYGDYNTTECPLQSAYAAAINNPEWKYLVTDMRNQGAQQDPNGGAALQKPGRYLLLNVVVNGDDPIKTRVGVMNKSASDCLIDKDKNGLVWQQAHMVPADLLAQNYMYQWAYGDITNPDNGPVFVVVKGKDKGSMSGYITSVMMDGNRMRTANVNNPALMAGRKDLSNLDNVMTRQTPERIVRTLVMQLNARSQGGRHEYDFLRMAFPAFRDIIPQAPEAPAAIPTVQGFTTPAPAFGGATPYAPSGFAQPQPTPAQPTGFAPPQAQAPANTWVPANPQTQAPVSPAFVPTAEPGPFGTAPATSATSAPVTVPGDPVAAVGKAEFLAKLQKR